MNVHNAIFERGLDDVRIRLERQRKAALERTIRAFAQMMFPVAAVRVVRSAALGRDSHRAFGEFDVDIRVLDTRKFDRHFVAIIILEGVCNGTQGATAGLDAGALQTDRSRLGRTQDFRPSLHGTAHLRVFVLARDRLVIGDDGKRVRRREHFAGKAPRDFVPLTFSAAKAAGDVIKDAVYLAPKAEAFLIPGTPIGAPKGANET